MIPALVQWEFTDKCSYRCQHCYHKNPSDHSNISLGLSEEAMWQIAKIIASNKLFFVTFTGGEPLMRKELLVRIAEYLHDQGMILSLNTNLSLVNRNLLKCLKVHRILVSCPSTNAQVYRAITGNGDYNQFERKLKMLIETGFNFTVNMVVSKLNYQLVRETAGRMAVLGVKRFAATPTSINATNPNHSILLDSDKVKTVINDLIWAYENLGLEVDIMESVPKCIMPHKAFELELPFIYRSCHAGQRNGTISAKGDVRPCSHNPLIFGNILKEDIGTIWNRMHNWRELSGNVHQDCLGCDIFSNCGGGCRIDSEIRLGKQNEKHPYMSVKHIAPIVKPQTVNLTPCTMIWRVKSFQSRPEDGGWLVAAGSSRNIINVNQEMYDFLIKTRDLPPMTIKSLAEQFGTNSDNNEFRRVITELIRKKFFVIK